MATDPGPETRPGTNEALPEGEPVRSEEQDVASGQAPETPATVLFSVVGIIGAVALVVIGIVAIVYWVA